jgi:eukaryotic-like serine/threonine-protein kinase
MSKEKLEQALKIWLERLADYEHELSCTSNPSLKFDLRKSIKECEEEIEKLKNRLKSDVLDPNLVKTPSLTTPFNIAHKSFTFDTAQVEISGSKVDIIKTQKQAEYIEFDLYAAGKLELVYIPSGRFLMGQTATETRALTVEVREEIYQTYYARELPQHPVDVSAFYMSKYPITQGQYLVVMGSNPGYFGGDRFPVRNVSWHDAQSFCQQLSQKTGTKIGLPSEAQWEYACRAETHTPFHFGETITKKLGNYTYGETLKAKDRGKATPVGSYQVANDFGLYDMHGNVWEWCLDRYHENYQNAPQDGGAWVDKNDSDSRILRGGSWDNLPRDCRSTFGFGITPDLRHDTVGFRVVCEIPRTL